ncbi:hypothetical protein [Inconstantimicrobium porci]|uniref:Uncharacterized protein n=1 Tax=Inconstantimicrobium porci TaxID=2652291 RepID=A0A7X2MVP1_9CLOT|nr:hypothetical protein [Inconstantimicrobium porci]MSR89904.1 hypothetical protein [Inconstantimicrobium porci]
MKITIRNLLKRIINSDKCNFEQKIAFSTMYFNNYEKLDDEIEDCSPYILLGYSRNEENVLKKYDTLDELYNDFNNADKIMKLNQNLVSNGFWRFVILKDLQPIDIDYDYTDNTKNQIVIDKKALGKKIENSKFTTFQHKVLYEYFEMMNLCQEKLRKELELDFDNEIIVEGKFKFILLRYHINGDCHAEGFNTICEVYSHIEQEYFDLKIKAEKEDYFWEYVLLQDGEIIDDKVNNSKEYSVNICKYNPLTYANLIKYHDNLVRVKEKGYKEGYEEGLKEAKEYNNKLYLK